MRRGAVLQCNNRHSRVDKASVVIKWIHQRSTLINCALSSALLETPQDTCKKNSAPFLPTIEA